MKFSLEKDYIGAVSLPEKFLSEKMNELDFSELKAYLKICLFCRQNKDEELSVLASATQINESEISDVVSSLEKKGLIKATQDGIVLVGENNSVKKSYEPQDFSADESNDIKMISAAAEGKELIMEQNKNLLREKTIEFAIEISDICDEIKGCTVYKNQLIRSSSSIGANLHEYVVNISAAH